MERIRILSGGEHMEGTLILPSKVQVQNPGAIFFHGMTSSEKNYIPIAERLAAHGIVGLTLSIRGHGNSEGDFNTLTVHDAVNDGLSTYDFFSRYDFIDKKRIGLCGASVGAAIASLISAERAVRSLVLRVPATYTEEMMGMTYTQITMKEGRIFQQISNISDTPALRAVKKFFGYLLVITSENDTIIPVAIPTSYLLSAEATKRKETVEIKGATHNLTEESWRDEFIKETVQWFVKTL